MEGATGLSEKFSEPAALRPYANYRSVDTGLIRRVPAHWQLRLAKHVAKVTFSSVDKHTIDGESPVRLCNYVDVYKHAMIRTGHPFMSASATPEEIDRFSLRAGDVLLTKDSEAWNDIGVPALIGEDLPGVLCGYHLAMLRPDPRAALGAYLYWALLAPSAAVQFHVAASGVTRYGLSKGDVKNVALPLPPLAEQAAIARYLGHFDAKVGRLLRAKRRLVALLTEQKQAVIQQAVTRGLDPDVPLRDSGVPWLGAVPAHWSVRRLSEFAISWCDGPFGSGLKSSHYVEGSGVRVVRLQNIGYGDFLPQSAVFVSPDHYLTLGDHSVVAGDVLIAGLGDARHSPGRACVAPLGLGEAMVKADCFRFRMRTDQVDAGFMALQLSATANIAGQVLASGATRQRVNLSTMASRQIALPSVAEQGAIVRILKPQCKAVDDAVTQALCEIDLIREYRTRLVADVVTGQLDVRDAAAGLPEIDALAEEAGWDAAGEDAGEDGALPDDADEAEADDADD